MNFLYDKPRSMALTIALIVVSGLFSFQLLPRLEDPPMPEIFAIVNTVFPGASAQRVESLVTDKLEQKIAEVSGIKYIESASRPGISTLSICLKDEYINQLDDTWSQVRDKIEDTIPLLPHSAQTPDFEKISVKSASLIVALTCDRDKENYSLLQRLRKDLRNVFRDVSGTKEIDFFGVPQEEIVVTPDLLKLIAIKQTPASIAQHIQLSDAKVPHGELRNKENRYAVEVNSELHSLEQIANIPIVQGERGHVVQLQDIATVSKSLLQPMTNMAFSDGRSAIVVAVSTESHIRVDLWSQQAKDMLQAWQKKLPRGVQLSVIFDQSHYITKRLSHLASNLLIGFAFVVIVTWLMMGWRSTLIIAIAFPLCILTVLALMRALQIPIHQISIVGLIVALGMLIDTNIITVHELQQAITKGMTARKAAAYTVSYLAIPLTCSTITTVLAFMPIAIMPGAGGTFIFSLGLCVILSLLSSLVLSLTVVVVLSGWLYSWKPYRQNYFRGLSLPRIQQMYGWTLQQLFRYPIVGIFIAILFPLVGFYQATNLQMRFFPPPDRNQLLIDVELAADRSIEQTKTVALRMWDTLRQNKEIEHIHWFVGQSAPRFFNNLLTTRKNIPHYAQAFVQLSSSQLNDAFYEKLQQHLNFAFPEARVVVRKLNQGPPFEAPIGLRIYGPDLEVLENWGDKIRLECSKISDMVHVRSNLAETASTFEFSFREEVVRRLGLDHTAISQQLTSLLEGTVGGSIIDDTEELPIRVQIPCADREQLEWIVSTQLIQGNKNIPLSALATVHLQPQYANIQRRNRKRYCRIDGFIRVGVAPEEVFSEFQRPWQKLQRQLPTGYTWEFGGEEEQRQEAVASLFSTLGILMVLMTASIVISFNSFRLTFIIVAVGILTIGAALGSLWVFNYEMGFMSIVGTMGLIGVAINDSIVVLAAICQNPQAKQGQVVAIQQIVFSSTRHVLATTITTIVGFSPLLLDKSGMWPPLAIVITGGILGGTLLALYFVPCAYLLLTRNSSSLSK